MSKFSGVDIFKKCGTMGAVETAARRGRGNKGKLSRRI